MTFIRKTSMKAYTFSLSAAFVNLFVLAFFTSLGALSAYALALVSAAVTWSVVAGLERRAYSRRRE